MELPPFTRPLRLIPDAEAWHMPPWASSPRIWDRHGEFLDIRGVHRLLHAANLPSAELLHMGARRLPGGGHALSVRAADVVPLLGRIVLDAHYHESGGCWHDTGEYRAARDMLGAMVVGEFFS